MDKNSLVSAGHIITDELSGAGLPPRVVMWMHATDTDSWKLWIIPHVSQKDKREFYRQLATIVSKRRDELGGFELADAEMITDKHPAIIGMRGAFRVKDKGVITVTNSIFNGFYLEEAFILQMDF